MKLSALFKDLDVKIHGKASLEVGDLSLHSKFVKPKDLFIAAKGFADDGNCYIEEAVQSGAECVLTDFYNPFLKVCQVITKDPKALVPILAKRFYKDPSKKLFLVGITGTNGKTTTSYILRHLLGEKQCALLGTIEYLIQDRSYPAPLTTPDSITLNKYMLEMTKSGCSSCVMEASSHALDQNRVSELSFDLGIFTNLSKEHLDYHKDMLSYAAAKSKLFEMATLGSIINLDDPYSDFMMHHSKARVYTYSVKESADLFATEIRASKEGTHFVANYKGEKKEVFLPLFGSFNAQNALAAMLACLIKGASFVEIIDRLKTLKPIPGRLEKLPLKGKSVYVDFAHKEKALEEVLKTLSSFKVGKLITVFGCGGNRDREKRPLMGAIAESFSDVVILTNDNPRSEDPDQILDEIEAGMKKQKEMYRIKDRKAAIQKALEMASSKDIVLIAGKGHETKQILSKKTIEFSDREVALAAL